MYVCQRSESLAIKIFLISISNKPPIHALFSLFLPLHLNKPFHYLYKTAFSFFHIWIKENLNNEPSKVSCWSSWGGSEVGDDQRSTSISIEDQQGVPCHSQTIFFFVTFFGFWLCCYHNVQAATEATGYYIHSFSKDYPHWGSGFHGSCPEAHGSDRIQWWWWPNCCTAKSPEEWGEFVCERKWS